MAKLVILIDLAIAFSTLITSIGQPWAASIDLSNARLLGICTLLNIVLLIASTDVSASVRSLISIAASTPMTGAKFGTVDRYRPFAFYPAIYINLTLIAVLTHITGGLSSSPYTSLVYAFLLSSQQFSRFRRQAGYYLLTGVVVTVALIVADSINSVGLAEAPPTKLVATFTIGSFAFAGLMNQLTKPGNPRSVKHSTLPSSGGIYMDHEGRWRMTLFSNKHAVDLPAVSGTAILPASRSEAETALENAFRVMHGDQNQKLSLVWKPDPVLPGSSATLEIDD